MYQGKLLPEFSVVSAWFNMQNKDLQTREAWGRSTLNMACASLVELLIVLITESFIAAYTISGTVTLNLQVCFSGW